MNQYLYNALSEKPNKAISNVAEASSLRDENTQNKSNLQAQSVSEEMIGTAGHSERSEESLINSSVKSVQSAVPVQFEPPKPNEAILIPCLTRHPPPKPLAEGEVDNPFAPPKRIKFPMYNILL